MTVVVRFATDDVLTCRFAISPARETMNAVRLLAAPHRQGYHLPWLRSIAPVIDRLHLAPLLRLMPCHTYNPDFLSPPPSGPRTRFDDELAMVRATPAAQVADELDRCLRPQHGSPWPVTSRALLDDPVSARDLLADLLETCWHELITPWWPRIIEVLEGDIAFRGRMLANGGLAAALTDLHPKLRWRQSALEITIALEAERRIDGAGLALMPSVFDWPNIGVALDPPWAPTIDYPARGIAALWQSAAEPSDGLHLLVGRTRARLLAALAEPASTTGLARRCGLPASTVSEQLLVLRNAGLVSTARTGRTLRHVRTPLGTALVNGHPGNPESP